MSISLIAAISSNRVIGYKGKIPWHLPDDLAYFKHVTMGKPIVMGRKTFESIGRPLPGRLNIVLTHDLHWQAEGVLAINTVEQALQYEDIMVIGGEQIYKLFLPLASRLYITQVNLKVNGDTFFPHYKADWREVSRIDGKDCTFIVLEK